MGSWTRACCEHCWDSKYRPEGGNPLRFKEEFRELDKCGHCGENTQSGIYVRIDPKDQYHNAPTD